MASKGSKRSTPKPLSIALPPLPPLKGVVLDKRSRALGTTYQCQHCRKPLGTFLYVFIACVCV
jgi:hypothetical protein